MPNANFISSGLALALLLAGCAAQSTGPENQPAKPLETSAPAFIPDKALIAQWVGYQETTAAVFDGLARHGQPTATGEPFDMYGLVAAHSRLPLGALIQVDAGGRSLVVRVTDRAAASSPLRLSYAAALALGVSANSRITVKLRVLGNE